MSNSNATRTLMRLTSAGLVLVFGFASLVLAQDADKSTKPTPVTATPAQPKEESSVTDHTIHLGGQTIPYKATASTILIKNDEGEPTALIYSTAYVRSDVKDASQRPIAFLYNGGPGSSSIWLHMGAYGPRRVVTANAQATPPAPYRVVDNSECLLDKADLVFIDPVGTGYSHAVGKAKDKDFWGVDEDVKSLAQFITAYVTRNNRWNSPKFLIGESYGTFRSVALGNYLQSTDHIDINGIVLMSSVLDLGTISFNSGDDYPYIFYLPTYAAAAWYYKTAPNRPDDLNALLVDARAFASTEYAAALMKGSHLSDAEKSAIAKKLMQFTGISEDYWAKADLRVNNAQFAAELQRKRGLTIGRYDGRYSGPTYDMLTEFAETDPSYTAVAGAFTAAFNTYVRQELKFNEDRNYEVLTNKAAPSWNWKHGHRDGFPGSPSVDGDLIRELLDNPHLQLQVENGYFDFATPFFATEYTMDHLSLPANLRDRIHLEYYHAGHMMYLHDEDRVNLKKNVAAFIDSATKQ